MNRALGDAAAIKFAMGFYDALGYDRTYPQAFEFGLSAIDLEEIPETATPVFRTQRGDVRSLGRSPQSTVSLQPPASSLKGQGSRVFISYRDQAPDNVLAQQFYEALTVADHTPFMAGASIQWGETWAQRIRAELAQSDYVLLLLSPQSATSEMVTEEVRCARALRDQQGSDRPVILPIRIQFPLEDPLNYDLRGYLQQIQQRQWESEADTQGLITDVLQLLQSGHRQRDISALPEVEAFVLPPAIESPDHPPRLSRNQN